MSNINRRDFAKSLGVKAGALSALAAVPAVTNVASAVPAETGKIRAAKIEILFKNGGRFVAKLRQEACPETCKYFMERLPFSLPTRRASMSGGMVTVSLEGWTFNKLEYVNTMIRAGEIGLLTTFLPHRPANKPYCQMIMPTSGRTQVHQMWGIASPTNRFAEIVEGSMDELGAIARRLANQGAADDEVTVKLL